MSQQLHIAATYVAKHLELLTSIHILCLSFKFSDAVAKPTRTFCLRNHNNPPTICILVGFYALPAVEEPTQHYAALRAAGAIFHGVTKRRRFSRDVNWDPMTDGYIWLPSCVHVQYIVAV